MARSFLPDIILDRPLRQFPDLLSSFFPNTWPGNEENFFPAADFPLKNGTRIYEKDDHLHVELPVPGLNGDDIEVSFSKGVLHVKGEAKEETHDKNRKDYFYSSRKYTCSLVLPVQIDDKQIQADYDNGILKISTPLAKAAESKKIPVKTGNKKK